VEVSYTKKSTRIVIWVIAIVMVAGFMGSYFLIILQNNNQNSPTSDTTTNQTQEKQQVDPTAYKVSGKVDSLQITDITKGAGAEAKAGDRVTVQYKGTLAQTGAKFDSSYDRGEPVTLSLGKVIAGWQQGIPGMKVGGKRRLVIPAALGYGAQPQTGIPANSDLVFEVELLGVGGQAGQ
jgi:FKBP-type peptidyl-prolyl cis-trans isomerase